MNYTQKSKEIFIELYHESWMTTSDWNEFLKTAKKKANYCIDYLANDLQSEFKTDVLINKIDNKLKEVRNFKQRYFA